MNQTVDMTEGYLGGKIFKYSMTVAATGVLQQLFNAADVAVIGRFCGTDAQAAVGGNAPIISILIVLFLGISVGCNVVIARLIGAGNKKKVSDAVHTSVATALLGGVLLMIIGELAAKSVVNAMNVPVEAADMSLLYLRIYFIGMPAVLLYNFETAVFRSCGNTRVPLIILFISGVINVGLNLLCIVVFKMTVDGVGVATVVSNAVSAVVLFVWLLRTDTDVKVSIRRIRIDKASLVQILKVGIPAGFQSMMSSISILFVQSAINSLGTTVMAASSAASSIDTFTYFVPNAFGVASATFVSQNYGAGNRKRCVDSVKLCFFQSVAVTAVLIVAVLIFARPLLSLFNTSDDVIEVGITRLRFMFLTYMICIPIEIFNGYLRSFGIVNSVTLCDITGLFVVRIAWIMTVFKKSPSFVTLMKVYPLGMTVTAVLTLAVMLVVRPSKRYFDVKGS